MYEDIEQYVKTCLICQQYKRAFHGKQQPIQLQPVDDEFSRWHMDILSGLWKTKEEYIHVFHVVNSYSKWCDCFPLRTQEASELLQCYSGESFCNMVVAPGVLSVTEGGTL